MHRRMAKHRATSRAATSRRSVRAATAITATTLMLAVGGCAGSTSDSAATDGDGQTVLTVYGWKGGDTEPANIAEVNAAFQEAHPEITLKFEYVPANDSYTQRVQPELLAANSADVIMTDSGKVQDWGAAGYLEDLSDADWNSSVIPELVPFISESDTVYALPMEIIGISLYANVDLLTQAGVDAVPTTWPEFTDALTKVQAAGITPIALPNKSAWTGSSVLNAIAATNVYSQNPDWDEQFLAGDASFADWKSSTEQLMQLQEDGFVDYRTELGVDEWSQGVPDFTSGKSAFWFQGAWNQSTVTEAGINNVFIPWPAGDEGVEPYANLFVGTMWSINADSAVKDAARTYVEFWADSDNAAPYLEAENAVTPFVDGKSPSTDATESFVAAYEAGRYRILPSNTWFDTAGEKAIQQEVQSLQLGQVTVDEFLVNLDGLLR